MKKIKQIVVLIMFSGLVITGMQSCTKYPDGQLINFQTRTNRVSNNWQVENYKIKDVDYTSLVSNYTELFTKEGNYSYQWGIISGNGTWEFQNKDKEILITGINNQSNRKLIILKLEKDAFWYYYMNGDDKHEIHLIHK